MEKGIWLLITGPVIPVFRLKKQTSKKKELTRGKTRRGFVSVAATTYNKSRAGLVMIANHRNTAPPSNRTSHPTPLLTKDELKRVLMPSLHGRKRGIVTLIGRRPGISTAGVPGTVSHLPPDPIFITQQSQTNKGEHSECICLLPIYEVTDVTGRSESPS